MKNARAVRVAMMKEKTMPNPNDVTGLRMDLERAVNGGNAIKFDHLAAAVLLNALVLGDEALNAQLDHMDRSMTGEPDGVKALLAAVTACRGVTLDYVRAGHVADALNTPVSADYKDGLATGRADMDNTVATLTAQHRAETDAILATLADVQERLRRAEIAVRVFEAIPIGPMLGIIAGELTPRRVVGAERPA